MKAAFIGFGELGQQLLSFAQSQFSVDEIVVFDDKYSGERFQKFSFNEYSSRRFSDFYFFVGLGYKHLLLKRKVIAELLNLSRKLPSMVHPSGFLSKEVSIPPAVYIYPMCNIDKGVKLNTGVLLNNTVTVSHDCIIGESSYLSPGVVLSGNVKIGQGVFLGSATVVSNGVTIGNEVISGIGTSITKNVERGSAIIGNPFKKVSGLTIY
jgi:acetyltransferase EpsM